MGRGRGGRGGGSAVSARAGQGAGTGTQNAVASGTGSLSLREARQALRDAGADARGTAFNNLVQQAQGTDVSGQQAATILNGAGNNRSLSQVANSLGVSEQEAGRLVARVANRINAPTRNFGGIRTVFARESLRAANN